MQGSVVSWGGAGILSGTKLALAVFAALAVDPCFCILRAAGVSRSLTTMTTWGLLQLTCANRVSKRAQTMAWMPLFKRCCWTIISSMPAHTHQLRNFTMVGCCWLVVIWMLDLKERMFVSWTRYCVIHASWLVVGRWCSNSQKSESVKNTFKWDDGSWSAGLVGGNDGEASEGIKYAVCH